MPKTPMDQEAKSRVMSSGASKTGGQTEKGSWEARGQVNIIN